MTMLHSAWLLTMTTLAASCSTSPIELSAYPELHQAMLHLQQEQVRFDAAKTVPSRLDFPGQGRITIRDVSLDGYPGNIYVRCRFHYENNTGRPVLRSLVSLDVLDAAGRMVASQVSVLIFPTPRAIYDGTFFSDELRTQTLGVQTQAGWTWRMTCRSEFMAEDER